MVAKNDNPMSQAVRQVVKEFGEHPYDINDGRCDEFAGRVIELVPEAEDWPLDGHGHIVMRYKGKFYDAEEPEGVTHWKLLPLLVRNRRGRCHGAI